MKDLENPRSVTKVKTWFALIHQLIVRLGRRADANVAILTQVDIGGTEIEGSYAPAKDLKRV